MSRLPDPPDIAPAEYERAARHRARALGELLDRVIADADLPALGSALQLSVAEIVDHIHVAVSNDAQGTNVVPHLLTSLDALASELRTLLERLARA